MIVENTPAPTPTPTPAPTPTPSPESWFSGLDADTTGYVTNRGLDKGDAKAAALAAIKSHREAERLLGAGVENLMRAPKDINDTATRDAAWNRLGRPAEAAGYDYTGVPGVDPDFVKFVNPIFHANGVTAAGAKDILGKITAAAQAQETEAAKAREVILATEKTALLKDWGGAADANLVVAQAAAKKLNISEEQLAAIEAQIGFGKTMSMFLNLGQKIGEDPFVNPNSSSGGPPRITSKEGAQARKTELMADAAWTKDFLAGKVENVKEMTALNTLISAE